MIMVFLLVMIMVFGWGLVMTMVFLFILPGVGLGKLSPLAQQVGHQLLGKGGVGGLGEERLLLEDGEEGHGLLKHVNALLQIHPKVNVCPVQAFSNIFLLLEGEPKRYSSAIYVM